MASVALATGVATVAILGVGAAHAALPVLWDSCPPGAAAGECRLPRGVVASPASGRLFVGDQANRRVVELDALGEFVKAWGWDVVATGPGDDTVVPEDEFEVCVPEDGDLCKAGVSGTGPGQFGAFGNSLPGLEVDAAGDVHVVDRNNRRVQKFSPAGEFLLMYGGEVNKTTGADICAQADLDGGDECGAGTTGLASGEFGAWPAGDFIALGADDRIYVGDVGRIQRFGADGAYQAECTTPNTVQSLAADTTGGLYAIADGGPAVRKLTFVAGEECEELEPSFSIPPPAPATNPRPISVAVDVTGQVYAFSDLAFSSGTQFDRIFVFDAAGNVVDQFGKGELLPLGSLATNICSGSGPPGNLYVTTFQDPFLGGQGFLRAYGTEPIGCFKARTLPATNVTETSARLNGTVNPGGALIAECRFEWGTTTSYGNVAPCAQSPAQIGEGTDPVAVHADLSGLAAATNYHFRLRAKVNGETETGPDVQFKTKGPPVISDQHVVGATATTATVRALVNPEGFPTSCRVEYGLTDAYGQSTAPIAIGEDRSDHPTTIVIEGLEEGTTYHWRFACQNTAVANGGLIEGPDRTLNTFRTPDVRPCPNDEFRYGPSAALPDCRAYEMVSPVDKNGADIVAGPALEGSDIAGFAQGATSGEKLAYAAKFPAFADPSNSFAFNQYLAERTERGLPGEGWSNESINPPYLGEPSSSAVPIGINRLFVAFTADLCSAWLIDQQSPPLNPDGQLKAANLYRRNNCEPGAGSFETVTDAPLSLEGEARSQYVTRDSVQGHSADGAHAVFVAKAKLTPDAAEGTKAQLYDRFQGGLHLVSVLPGGAPSPTSAAVGSGWGGNLEHAVSEDGSRVYWTAGSATASTGQIYLRLQEEGRTIEVSEELDNGFPFLDDAFFWAASPDGSRALYSERESLYLFDLATEESQLVAGSVMGIAGTSDDLSRIYFVSRAVLSGSGANSEGAEAVADEPNLYLAEGGAFAFIGALAEGDVGQLESGAQLAAIPYDVIAKNTIRRATRVSADGARIAFNSRAQLTDFDNVLTDGRRAVEVFGYDALADRLLCVSCNPSGARPQARELPEPYAPPGRGRATKVQAAAWIPTWEHPTHASNALSADGNRLFFNSNDSLLPADQNGAQDVYEWEAPGAGSCDTVDSNYFPARGGCIYLLSSAESSFESIFWEASPDGDDVFFTTDSSLLPQDPGSVDLYDARVDGGFPQPPVPEECDPEAEDCRSPGPPPQFGTPASSAPGPGNPAPPRNCRRLAKRATKLSRTAKRARRAARRAGKPAAAKRLRRKAARAAKGARRARANARRCRRASRGEGR